MKALTLWRPWPWAIFHAPRFAKRIENRSWKPPAFIIGKPLVIHAGKKFDRDSVDEVIEKTTMGGHPHIIPAQASDEGLIGVATVTGYVVSAEAAAANPGQERWFAGPFGWVLADVWAFPEPIACRGAQGLWHLPMWAQLRVAELLRDRGPLGCDHRYVRPNLVPLGGATCADCGAPVTM